MRLLADYSKRAKSKCSVFVTFPYRELYVSVIKQMPVRFFDKSTKAWEIPLSDVSKLQQLLKQYNVSYNEQEYAQSVKDLNDNLSGAIHKVEHKLDTSVLDKVVFKTEPRDYQKEGIVFGLKNKQFLLADDMGCVDQDTVIQINISGASKKVTIKEAYRRFKTFKKRKFFRVRCLKDDYFGQQDVQDIIYSGNKECYKLTLESGKYLIATPDHEVLTTKGYTPLIKLNKDTDKVIVNGKLVCPLCGSTENIASNPDSKFYGYCKKCIYTKLRKNHHYEYKRRLFHGYWFITGKCVQNHHLYTAGGVPEHQLIAEQKYGRPLDLSFEVVHHVDGNPQNNDPDNLVIMTAKEHAKLHSEKFFKHLYAHDYEKKDGTRIIVVPKEEKIKSIEYVGYRDVYDIKMHDPYRNFVANGIVVHNCGKSFQSLNIARLKKNGQHCLIICGYATLQYNWKLEAEKHTNQSAYILGTRIKPRKKKEYIGTTQDKMEDLENLENISEFFIITNVNFIRSSIKQPYKNKDGENKSYKTYPVAEKINELCRKGVIGRIIFDEFQVAKSIDTDNAKAVLAITDCDYKIAATGTPLMNNHADLYTVMKWLGQMPLNYYSFVNTYCIMGGFKNQQIIGNKNNKELNIRLSNFMLRRKKSDVLDLPEKNYIDVNLLMGMLQDNLYEKTRNMLKADVAKNRSNKMKILEMITALRKVTAHSYWLNTNYTESVKFDKIQELMETITASGEKAIILSNWTTPFDGLEKYSLDYILSDYKPLAITGDVSQEQRFEYMNKFQNEDENKIIFGTYRAMGVGLTLTAANNVILLDQPWNKALEDQGIDRTHRIGTKKTVNVFKLMCHDTVDEWVNKLVLSKGKVSAETIDGEIMDEFIESLLI